MARRTRREADLSWQETGYFWQPLACERAAAIDDSSDTGYVTPIILRQDGPESAPWEEGNDPSLRAARSDSLKKRGSGFWRKAKGSDERGKVIQRILLAVAAVALLAVAGYTAYRVMYTIRTVTVQGNSLISADAIKMYTGVQEGRNVLTISDDAVDRGIRQNRYLAKVVVDRNDLRNVVLNVTERTQDAYMRYCGITYVLDSHGMVLEETDEADALPDMMKLEGLNVRSCVLGRKLTVFDAEQLNIFREVVIELKVLGLVDEVTELYVGDTNNITIATKGGYSVRMGDSSRIHEKLRAMQLVCDYLAEGQYTGGTVDVSSPEEPTWIPGIDSAA